MDADYTVELGPEAPALEFPWRDPDGRLQYFDLRSDPSTIEHLPEAKQFPVLGRFLIEMNSPRNHWQTAKCDTWSEPAEPGENLYGAAFAQSCYVDLVLAGEAAALRESLEIHQETAKKIARALEADEELEATAEIVVRRCYFHVGGAAEAFWETSTAGYCLTQFLTGYGATAEEAILRWEQALRFSAACMLACPLHEGRAKARELR